MKRGILAFAGILLLGTLCSATEYVQNGGSSLSQNITVLPGSHTFRVSPVGWGWDTDWYITYSGGSPVEHDANTSATYFDPKYTRSFTSDSMWIRAEIYNSSGGWEETHRWYVTVAPPDISRVSPSSPVTVQKGASQSFSVNVANAGGGYIRWEIDGAFQRNSSDWLGESGNDSESFSFSSLGPHTLTAQLTAYGQTDSISWTVNVPFPDISRVSPNSPVTVQKGAGQLFSVNVANAGGGYIRWEIDGAFQRNSSDWLGESGNDSESFSFSSLGPHTLTAKLYANGESDTLTWTVNVPYPDISRVSPNSPVTVQKGAGQSFSVNVANAGGGYIRWEIDGAFQRNSSDWLGESGNDSESFSFSSLGPHTLTARLYANGESDTLTWSVNVSQPDLIVTSVWTEPSSPTQGQSYVVKAKVKNDSNINAVPGDGCINVRFYIGITDLGQETDWKGTINAGDSYTFTSGSKTAPAVGPYTLKAVADSQGDVAESSEGNNEGTASVTVQAQKGNLDVTVKNQNGTAISGATVSRYNASWIPIDSKTTDGSGKASWTGVPIGIYNLEAYYNGEYWVYGSATVNNGATTSTTLQRNEPYAYDCKVFMGSTEVTGGTVAPNTPLTLRVYVRNSSPVSRTARVQLWLDRDKASVFDFNQTSASQAISANGGTATYTFSYTPAVESDFYRQLRVDTTVNSAWAKTDSWPWGLAVTSMTGSKPEVGAIQIREFDPEFIVGTNATTLLPGKRYVIDAEFTDADLRTDLTSCAVQLYNSSDSRLIHLGYSLATGRKSVEDGYGNGINDGGTAAPVQDSYACLTHVEKQEILNGYRIRYIFWLTAKWANRTGGVDVRGRVVDTAIHVEEGDWAGKNLSFTAQSLPAGKWSVIVHGKSNSLQNLPVLGLGPCMWKNNLDGVTSKWFDDGSKPAIGHLDEGWGFRLGQKYNRISKTPVKIHRLKNREAFELETWDDPSNETLGYRTFNADTNAHHVLLFEWDDPSDYVNYDEDGGQWWRDNWYAYATADALFALGAKMDFNARLTCLIGYSRGAIVSSEYARRVLRWKGDAKFQVVYLDGEGWGEFENEVKTTPVLLEDITFGYNLSWLVQLAGIDYNDPSDYGIYPTWSYINPTQMANALKDKEFHDAQELSYFKYLCGFGYADYKFLAWAGTRTDQYREAFSNPSKAFCGAESLTNGNDRTVETWPEYSTITMSVASDTLYGGHNAAIKELSHSYFMHYLADWCYLTVDSRFGNKVCIETPQLWKWKDKNGVWQSGSPSAVPTAVPGAPENVFGGVFNGEAKDGSAAGWTYHGGYTPFENSGVESIGDGYEFQFESLWGLVHLRHNWQVSPAGVSWIRFDVEYKDVLWYEQDNLDLYWEGVYLGTVDSEDVWNQQESKTFSFGYPNNTGRLRFNTVNLGAEFLVDNVEFVQGNRPVVGTLTGTPNPIVQGANLKLVAGGVIPGDNAISYVRFYHDDNGNGQYDINVDQPFGPAVYSGSSGNWQLTWATADIPAGQHYFFAFAYDVQGLVSAPVPIPPRIDITQPANQAPTIGGLSDSPDPVDRGANMTLTASSVADADGTVARVDFYHDANNNGVFDEGTGDKVGTDTTIVSGQASVTFNTGVLIMPAGTQTRRFFAVAYDNQGAASGPASCRTTIVQKWNLAYQVSPVGGGTIIANPAAGSYADRTQVNPSAQAAANYSFDHWEVNGVTKTMPVSLTANTTIRAVFVLSGGAVPPVLNAVGNQSVNFGNAFSLTVTKQQGDAPIVWTLESAPAGMVINTMLNSSGLVSWPNPSPAGSSHYITVKAANGAGSDTESWTLYVSEDPALNHAPVLSSIEYKGVMANKSLAFTISASDADGTVPNVGMSGAPIGSFLYDHDDGTALFSWTPSVSDIGEHAVTFTASDGLLTDSEAVIINVSTFEVTKPTDDIKAQAGKTVEVSWTGPSPLGDVDVQLWKGGVYVDSLASGSIAPTSTVLIAPELATSLKSGKDYFVRVIDGSNSDNYADSAQFEIKAGGLPWLNLLLLNDEE